MLSIFSFTVMLFCYIIITLIIIKFRRLFNEFSC